MSYIEFWKANGLDFIVPPGGDNPEGFDVGAVLKEITGGGRVLEIGCGTGRIAKHFGPWEYTGVDVNPAALAVAMKALPLHAFTQWDGDSMLPKAATALLYTVCLHVPDDKIADVLRRAAEAAPRVVIAEIMEPKFRKVAPGGYSISNQRSLADYIGLAGDVGLQVAGVTALPYAFYPGEFITFAIFERVKV